MDIYVTASVEQQGFQKSRRGQEGSQGPREERKKGPSEGGRTELGVRHLRGVPISRGVQPWDSARCRAALQTASVHFQLFWGIIPDSISSQMRKRGSLAVLCNAQTPQGLVGMQAASSSV